MRARSIAATAASQLAKAALFATAMSFPLAGCGETLPTGEDALREIIPAMTGSDIDQQPEAQAAEMAQLGVLLGSGVTGGKDDKAWDEAALKPKVAAAFDANRAAVRNAMYARLAADIPAEQITGLIEDVRDPARQKMLKCAFIPRGFRMDFKTCDIDVFGDKLAFFKRYAALKGAMDKALDEPLIMGAAGSAACDVFEGFLTPERKAQSALTIGDFKVDRDGKKYSCDDFRQMVSSAATNKTPPDR